jgi:hypothetical protein
MRNAHLAEPVKIATAIMVAGAMLSAADVADAADPDAGSASIGPPVILFSLDPPTPAPTPHGGAQRNAGAATAPAKRPAVPVQRIPLDAKPLIPPAQTAAKLGAPPDPRPPLPLDTDLLPLAAAPADGDAPPPAKPPSS